MPSFHKLKVKDIKRETPQCVSIAFDIPDSLKSEFSYKQGQYLTLKKEIKGEEVRRSYSVCSSPTADPHMRIAVKEIENGRMSPFLNKTLSVGDELDVMTPMGNFYTEMPQPQEQHYLAFAAGSGITPVMSLLKTALNAHSENKFTLFYGNRNTEQIIFKDELDSLLEKYRGRLQVIHILSREETSDPMFSGRISPEKCSDLLTKFDDIKKADEAFICGPFEMIMGVKDWLLSNGYAKDNVHFELFTTAEEAGVKEKVADNDAGSGSGECKVMVVLDGDEVEITVPEGETILDAVLDAGLDAPYACTGGSCCTCRAKVMEGAAEMEVNYALTDKEVEEGYILTCQSHPTTPTMIVDYDEP